MDNLFVFDIETIPDTEAGKKILGLNDLNEAEIAEAMYSKYNTEFLPHYLHRIVAISVLLRSRDKAKLWTLGDEDASEKEILERFFAGIDKFTPTLVTWNGGGFDLPVIHYRALVHGVAAPRYWETGADDQSFRWNNYLNRYHTRHTDVMDMIAGYQTRANAPLDGIATMLGFPGKMGMDGSKVFGAFLDGNLKAIRDYCETDVLNTYLVYLRFELIRGHLSQSRYENEIEAVKDLLHDDDAQDKVHLQEFAAEMA